MSRPENGAVQGGEDESERPGVATVPPPAGEEDAYNAPTKVGEVTNDAWAKLIAEANEQQAQEEAASEAKREEKKDKLPPVTVPPAPVSVPEGPMKIVRLFEADEAAEDEDDNAATLLNQFSKPPTQPPPEEFLDDDDLEPASVSGAGIARRLDPPAMDARVVSSPSIGPGPLQPAPFGPFHKPHPSVRAALEARLDWLVRPAPGATDYLPWVLGAAIFAGLLTLTVGIIVALG